MIVIFLLIAMVIKLADAKTIGINTDLSMYPSLIRGVDRYVGDSISPRELYQIYGKFKSSGISPVLGYAIMLQESGMRPNAINLNTNGTYDYGAWQINSKNLFSWRFRMNKYTSHNVFDPVQASDMAIETLKWCKSVYGYSWNMVECYNKGGRAKGKTDYRKAVKQKIASAVNVLKTQIAGIIGGMPAFAEASLPQEDSVDMPEKHIKKMFDVIGDGSNMIRLRRPDGSEVVMKLDERVGEVVGMTIPKGQAGQGATMDLSPSNVDPKPSVNKLLFALSTVIYVVFTGYLLFMAGMNLRNGELMYFMIDLIMWFILSGVMYTLLQKMRVF